MKISTKEVLKERQRIMAEEVVIYPDHQPFKLHSKDLIFSLDVQYDGDDAYVAVDIQEWNGHLIGQYLHHTKAEVPYIPGLFSFREGAVLKPAIQTLIKDWAMKPRLLLIDGHGTAHPRKFGVACWLGLELNLPAIGCAKEPLIKYDGDLGEERGSVLLLYQEKQQVGCVLRTRENVKPVYVSAGHKISQLASADIVLKLSNQYRISEPIRRADHVARRFAKGEFNTGMVQIHHK